MREGGLSKKTEITSAAYTEVRDSAELSNSPRIKHQQYDVLITDSIRFNFGDDVFVSGRRGRRERRSVYHYPGMYTSDYYDSRSAFRVRQLHINAFHCLIQSSGMTVHTRYFTAKTATRVDE